MLFLHPGIVAQLFASEISKFKSSIQHMKTPEIIVGSAVKILLGQHKGKHCKVAGIGACGHPAHDVLAVIDLGFPHGVDPIFVFRMQCEFLAPPLPPIVCRPDPAPTTERVCRFREGDKVCVCQPALTQHGETGLVKEVHLDPTAADSVRGGMPLLHARYVVSFTRTAVTPVGCYVNDEYITFWDNELSHA